MTIVDERKWELTMVYELGDGERVSELAPDLSAPSSSPTRANYPEAGRIFGFTVVLSESVGANEEEATAMDEIDEDRWITRQELADRYGVPVKTPAEWASKGTGPRYAKFGRHVRYRLSDVFDWEVKQYSEAKREPA